MTSTRVPLLEAPGANRTQFRPRLSQTGAKFGYDLRGPPAVAPIEATEASRTREGPKSLQENGLGLSETHPRAHHRSRKNVSEGHGKRRFWVAFAWHSRAFLRGIRWHSLAFAGIRRHSPSVRAHGAMVFPRFLPSDQLKKLREQTPFKILKRVSEVWCTALTTNEREVLLGV